MTAQRKWLLLVSVLLFMVLAFTAVLMLQPRLETMHKVIEKEYQSVAHLSASGFAELDADTVVIFDVREPKEFEVSHIDGAIQIMPAIEPSEFIQNYGDLLAGKQVVFYCSVGRRSSALLSKLADAPFKLGAQSSYNLIGGVFSWVNQGRQLSSSSQAMTNQVHPYNRYWGRLVEDQSKLSYTAD
ncbi:MAG: rhodanese-related sulfurtransferase [Arenicella sp.]|jgi:rhodanese-related sulfurtransferase